MTETLPPPPYDRLPALIAHGAPADVTNALRAVMLANLLRYAKAAAPFYADRIPQAVLEPSAAGGAAKVARKGTGLFRVRFTGVPSHAGLDPEKGASALRALAEFVLDAPRFASVDLGTTVTPTIASAGTKSNVVPENAG